MKVQKIEQPVALPSLPACGSVEGLPGSPPIQLFGLEQPLPGKEDIDTGIFECTEGSYRRGVKQAEIMHILSGSGTFTPDGEAPVTFRGGDTLFFEAHTQGTWVVETRMRKLYVIFDAR